MYCRWKSLYDKGQRLRSLCSKGDLAAARTLLSRLAEDNGTRQAASAAPAAAVTAAVVNWEAGEPLRAAAEAGDADMVRGNKIIFT